MHPLLILLNLAAAVMLLLWAVRMVRTGVERAYGTMLRAAVRHSKGGVVGMAALGMVLAVVLQSSTAVGILATGFAGSGILSIGTGLAALLGADLGSALVVKILSFDLSELVPVLILIGTTLFLKLENRQWRQSGRIVLGIGFILLSLRMVSQATEPLRDSPMLPAAMTYLQGDPVTAFIVAALLAWGLHSSVATLLLLVTFAASRVLPLEVALPMVLGVNFGAGVVAVWLTRDEALPARHIPLGNLIFRGVGAVVALTLLVLVQPSVSPLGQTPATQLVNFHMAFNLALLVLALPLVGPMERLTARLWPCPVVQTAEVQQGYPSALDRAALAHPTQACAAVKRELLLMGGALDMMLQPVMGQLHQPDPVQITRLKTLDAEVNRRHGAIKLYLAELSRAHPAPDTSSDLSRRSMDLISTAIDFDYIGDLVAKTLLSLAETRAREGVQLTPEGWDELTAMHARVVANLQLALNVLISEDVESARRLADEKAVMRQMERESQNHHLARLQSGQEQSIDTSDIHLEVVRSLKEINSLLIKVAYPVLAAHGHLLESRLALAPRVADQNES